MDVKIKDINVRILRGDLVRQDVDAIVCPTSTNLQMVRGVAEVIKNIGGDIIQDEAESKAGVEEGQVIHTTAGNLSAKYIFHAAIMGQDIRPERTSMKKVMENVFGLSEKLKVKSIAFPAFGTASSQFPYDMCGRIMLSSVIDYIQAKVEGRSLELIVFCLFNDVAYNAFVKAMEILKQEYFLI